MKNKICLIRTYHSDNYFNINYSNYQLNSLTNNIDIFYKKISDNIYNKYLNEFTIYNLNDNFYNILLMFEKYYDFIGEDHGMYLHQNFNIEFDKNINNYINKTTLKTFINNYKEYVSTPTPEETFLNIYFEKHIDILKELSLLPLNVQSTINSDVYRFYDLDKYKLFDPNFPKDDAYYELTKYDFIHLIQKPWSSGINSKEYVYSIWYVYVYFTMQILINKRNILDL